MSGINLLSCNAGTCGKWCSEAKRKLMPDDRMTHSSVKMLLWKKHPTNTRDAVKPPANNRCSRSQCGARAHRYVCQTNTCMYVHINKHIYIYIYGGCPIFLCARTVMQKLGFVELGLQSFRVDCARAILSSVFVVHTATHKGSSR